MRSRISSVNFCILIRVCEQQPNLRLSISGFRTRTTTWSIKCIWIQINCIMQLEQWRLWKTIPWTRNRYLTFQGKKFTQNKKENKRRTLPWKKRCYPWFLKCLWMSNSGSPSSSYSTQLTNLARESSVKMNSKWATINSSNILWKCKIKRRHTFWKTRILQKIINN